MLDKVLDKNKKQASTVVLDLSRLKFTPDDLAKAIYQGDITTGVKVTAQGKKQLRFVEELIVIDAKGNMNTIFPP